MIIDTGTKGFWLGALFLVLMLDSILSIVCGVVGGKKAQEWTLINSLDGFIMLVIAVGWWVSV